jgi:hypothetical protein
MGKQIKQSLAGALSVSIRGGSVSIRVWITFSLFWVFPKNMKDCGKSEIGILYRKPSRYPNRKRRVTACQPILRRSSPS